MKATITIIFIFHSFLLLNPYFRSFEGSNKFITNANQCDKIDQRQKISYLVLRAFFFFASTLPAKGSGITGF